ncbi:MAG: hypothetical protein ACC645_14075 [Pirellulales bacterium]
MFFRPNATSSHAARAAGAVLVVLLINNIALGADEATKAEIGLKKVVLFNTGIGYFERQGVVHDNAAVELVFDDQDINDLLKSLIVQDLGGGRVESITYGSQDRRDEKLRALSIDLDDEPTVRELLSQLRGEQIHIEGNPSLSGTIVGTETRTLQTEEDEDDLVVYQLLTLLTDDGLQSIPFSSIQAVKLADKRLDRELREALAILAGNRRADRHTVTIHFAGRGPRPVRIGYIRATPIWKATYRLVLGDKDQALLQGWAIVENPSDTDWNDLSLTLISGRPISFAMDLYQPLYVRRPQVKPRVFGSAAPHDHTEGDGEELADFDSLMELITTTVEPGPFETNLSRAMAGGGGFGFGGGGGGGGGFGFGGGGFGGGGFGGGGGGGGGGGLGGGGLGGGFGGGGGGGGGGGLGGGGRKPQPRQQLGPFDPSQGVASAARSREIAELFEYHIEHPVTLGSHQSALIPIVDAQLHIRRISIYSESIDPRHPLNGLKLTNTTKLLLTHGPITVFDAATYAGDARLPSLPAGKQRLISYGLDLETEVTKTHGVLPTQLAGVTRHGSKLTIRRHKRHEYGYRIRNTASSPKQVLVEFKRNKGWDVEQPAKATETAGRINRYQVEVAPTATETLKVIERQQTDQHADLDDLSPELRRELLASPRIAASVKDLIRALGHKENELREVVEARRDLTAQATTIAEQQKRIRQNMEKLDKDAPLYIRYVEKLSQQEDVMEDLQKRLTRLDAAQAKVQAAIRQLVAGPADEPADGNEDQEAGQ